LLNTLNDSDEQPIRIRNNGGLRDDSADSKLPSLLITKDGEQLIMPGGKEPDLAKRYTDQFLFVPDANFAPSPGEGATMTDPELAAPMSAKTKSALMKDAAEFAPVHNADGSTTYTVVQSGITDRPGQDSGIDYYKRAVNVTVPNDHASLQDCKFTFNERQKISKDEFDQILARDKASNPEVELYAHGVSATAMSADKQAMMLELSNGRPSINLDWNATNPSSSNNPMDSLDGYKKDTINAKRANDNKDFQNAIDNTIQQVGADHTTLIGFSHGGFFDTRYLAHRVQNNLPKLETVLLTHPDVPVSAPELQVNGKPELLKDSAQQSYVIGGTMDLAMKAAVLASHLSPHTPTWEGWFATEERLGNDSGDTRNFIQQEGAMAISERDRDEFSTEHFLNYAGINQLLDSPRSMAASNEQADYNAATDQGRAHQSGIIAGDFLTPYQATLQTAS
jgi:hypothetical protein